MELVVTRRRECEHLQSESEEWNRRAGDERAAALPQHVSRALLATGCTATLHPDRRRAEVRDDRVRPRTTREPRQRAQRDRERIAGRTAHHATRDRSSTTSSLAPTVSAIALPEPSRRMPIAGSRRAPAQ